MPLLLSETGTTDLVETHAYRMPYERNPLISLLPSGEKGVSSSTPLTNDNRRPGSLLPCRALFPRAPPHLHPHWTRTRRAGLGLTDQLPAHLHAAGPAWQGRCSAGRRALWRERLPGALGCSGESLLFSYLHSRTAGWAAWPWSRCFRTAPPRSTVTWTQLSRGSSGRVCDQGMGTAPEGLAGMVVSPQSCGPCILREVPTEAVNAGYLHHAQGWQAPFRF